MESKMCYKCQIYCVLGWKVLLQGAKKKKGTTSGQELQHNFSINPLALGREWKKGL